MNRRFGVFLLMVASFLLLFTFFALSIQQRALSRLPPSQTSIRILGNRDLRTVGDTATWCVVAHWSDGRYTLGNTALVLVATSDTSVAMQERSDVLQRCRPLLRAAGLPDSLALSQITWGTDQAMPERAT